MEQRDKVGGEGRGEEKRGGIPECSHDLNDSDLPICPVVVSLSLALFYLRFHSLRDCYYYCYH